jgi:hypothetical protein
MSSLAFDKQGKPFSFHRRAKRLLVRLFRNPGARGTCSQVLGADGQPLYVDTDTDYMEFRRAVNHVPGLYRLDQCDDDGNELEDTQAAYVSIDLPRNGVGGDSGTGDISPLVIIQQMAATQADVMKAMAAQQAALMAATAEILRAPYRPAPVALPELRNADTSKDNEDADDDDESDEAAAPEHPATVALRMMEPYLPQFGAFLYEQFIKFMQGRKSATTTSTAAPAQMPAPVQVAAASPTPAPVNAVATASSPSAARAQATAATVADRPSTVADTKPAQTPSSCSTQDPTNNSTANATSPASTVSPHDQLAHLYSIREKLSAKERAIAEHAISHMDAATHAHWLAELSAMSVDEATEMIRTMIAQLPQPPR